MEMGKMHYFSCHINGCKEEKILHQNPESYKIELTEQVLVQRKCFILNKVHFEKKGAKVKKHFYM